MILNTNAAFARKVTTDVIEKMYTQISSFPPFFAPSLLSGLILNDFIRHFEPIYYDAADLQQQHLRVRRAAIAAAVAISRG